jgi:homoserine O-acetyltransferase
VASDRFYHVVSFTSDWLFPTADRARACAQRLERAGVVAESKPIAADAFLLDVPEFFDISRAFPCNPQAAAA